MTNTLNHANATVAAPGVLANIPPEVTSVSGEMVLLTWLAFVIAFVLLRRLAWKPILRALEHRERGIKLALEEADQARRQVERLRDEQDRLVQEARKQALSVAEESRRSAERAVAQAEQQARDQSRRLLEEAERDIGRLRQRAADEMRREGATLALSLTERFLREELTDAQRQVLQSQAAGEVAP
ncbi:MAG: F0F1 ATP synthase subunit B [Kiritimatiellae bacterium]|nr:F0F1 ATP synthase subunit B [Kiritimatiellia bacterium]